MNREDYDFTSAEIRGEKQYYVLIIYDIIENKKRTKFAKFLEGYGKRVQKSAFEAFLTARKISALVSKIPSFCAMEDSIRVYRISGSGQVSVWGKASPEREKTIVLI